VGRRALTLWGIVALTILLMVTGGLACVGTPSANKGTVALILFYCWLYNVTIGATAYVALAEIGTSRLRAKTASIAIGVQGCFSVSSQLHYPFSWAFILFG
jgi:SP family general alpha glucoside:H+ symporter-like MFS transporter